VAKIEAGTFIFEWGTTDHKLKRFLTADSRVEKKHTIRGHKKKYIITQIGGFGNNNSELLSS